MSEQLDMNVTCLATPAESLSGRFVKMDRDFYGIIPGVDFHVDVLKRKVPSELYELK